MVACFLTNTRFAQIENAGGQAQFANAMRRSAS
jgi:hypothetical protein